MSEIAALASNIAQILSERKQTIGVAESSAGGLISAALLAVPGASSYFLGGAVVYTGQAKQIFVGLDKATTDSYRPATPRHAIDLARSARDTLDATWESAKPARPARLPTDTVIRRDTLALRWPAQSISAQRSRPGNRIGNRT